MKNIYSVLLLLLTSASLTYGQSHDTVYSHTGKEVYILEGHMPFKRKLSVYDPKTWIKLKQTKLTAITGEISLNANDSLLSFGSLGKIKTNDAQSLKPNKVFWERQPERIIVFDPALPTVCATATKKNSIQIIDLRTDSILVEIKKHTSPIRAISYRPDGALLVSLDRSGKLCIWALKERTLVTEREKVTEIPAWDSGGNLRTATFSIPLAPPGSDHSNFFPYKEPAAERFISPAIGYAPETGFTVGVGLIGVVQPTHGFGYYRPSVYTASVNYGFDGRQVLGKLAANTYIQDHWDLVLDAEYDAHGRNFYFGIGKAANFKDKQAYFSNNFRAAGSLFRLFGRQIGIGLSYDIRHNTPAEFQETSTTPPIGSSGGSLIGVGPIVRWDNRDNILSPTRGHLLDLSCLWYGPWKAGDYQYNEVKLDYRKYFPLGPSTAGRQLAIQGMADLTWGGNAPFYSLPYFTADRAFRGIYRNLYIDKQIAYVQTELRSLFSPADPRFGYAIFAGVADGAADFFKGYTSDIKGVYGLGLRQQLFPKNSFLLRLDAALTSKGEFGYYAGLGVSF